MLGRNDSYLFTYITPVVKGIKAYLDIQMFLNKYTIKIFLLFFAKQKFLLIRHNFITRRFLTYIWINWFVDDNVE